MLKKLLMLFIAVALSISAAFAASVDVNTADQTQLESLKGLGPVKSKAIIDERDKNGPFANADDLASRVKGLGVKSVTKLEAEGLTVGGSSAPPTGTKGSAKKPSMGSSGSKSAVESSPTATDTGGMAASSPKASKTKKGKKAKAASGASAASSP